MPTRYSLLLRHPWHYDRSLPQLRLGVVLRRHHGALSHNASCISCALTARHSLVLLPVRACSASATTILTPSTQAGAHLSDSLSSPLHCYGTPGRLCLPSSRECWADPARPDTTVHARIRKHHSLRENSPSPTRTGLCLVEARSPGTLLQHCGVGDGQAEPGARRASGMLVHGNRQEGGTRITQYRRGIAPRASRLMLGSHDGARHGQRSVEQAIVLHAGQRRRRPSLSGITRRWINRQCR